MTLLLVYFVIWTIVILISLTFILVLLRRSYMARWYRRLDVERARLGQFAANLEAPDAPLLPDFRSMPGSPAWIALEELLFKALESGAPGRERALKFFDCFGYTDHYLRKLKRSSHWTRALSADKLGRIDCKRAVPGLIQALSSKRRDVRNMAIHSLGLIRHPDAIMPLILQMSQVAVNLDEEVSLRIIKSALISFGEAAHPALLSELKNPLWQVRAAAADILSEGKGGEVAEAFMAALDDQEQDIRAKAAKGLGKMKHVPAVPKLYELFEDPFWVVRLHAVRAAGLIADPSSIGLIKEMLRDKNWQVRRVAGEALGNIGGSAFSELMEVYLYSTDEYARQQAADSMERTGILLALACLFHKNIKKTAVFDDIRGDKATSPSAIDEGIMVEIVRRIHFAGPHRGLDAVRALISEEVSWVEIKEAMEPIRIPGPKLSKSEILSP